MTQRYFYTDPLAAAWMAKHFGMVFNPANQKHFDNPRGILVVLPDVIQSGTHARYYVFPKSLHLLDPKIGDMLYTKVGGGISIEEIISEERQENAHLIIGRGGRIIQRNGIAFHWPESEAA